MLYDMSLAFFIPLPHFPLPSVIIDFPLIPGLTRNLIRISPQQIADQVRDESLSLLSQLRLFSIFHF